MPPVVADTGPVQYLVLINEIELLPRLFAEVTIPTAVQAEMLHPAAPEAVRNWATTPPRWLTVSLSSAQTDAALRPLGAGERTAIALALSLGAELILMDDRAGVAAALAARIAVIGTLGVLDRAARAGMVDLEAAFTKLKATNFRYPPPLLDAMLASSRGNRGR